MPPEIHGVRDRLSQAGIELPGVSSPVSRYVPMRVFGKLAFCAGVTSDGKRGSVEIDATIEDALEASASAAKRQLAYIEQAIGSLDEVSEVLRLTGYVACAPGFVHMPAVLDVASGIFLAAFGEAGQHARSAVGVASLPLGELVELEAVLVLK